MKNRRIRYAAIFAALLIAEILIGSFLKTGFIRVYAGDILVIPVLYFLIRIFLPKPTAAVSHFLPAGLFLIGAAAEILQAFDITGRLGIEKDSLLGILMGTVCDPMDLVCYAAGALLIFLYLFIEKKLEKENMKWKKQ